MNPSLFFIYFQPFITWDEVNEIDFYQYYKNCVFHYINIQIEENHDIITSTIFILILDLQMPRFISGFGTGIIQCGIIQFCIPKKISICHCNNMVVFYFYQHFYNILSSLYYFCIISFHLLGLVTYQFAVKKQLLYSQSIMTKNLQEIIKPFTSDYLFAISYNDRDRQFKLEFANTYFENLYQDDIKQILRMYCVVSDLDTLIKKRISRMKHYFLTIKQKRRTMKTLIQSENKTYGK